MKSLFSATDSSEHPAPQAVYNWKIYLLAISAAMGAALQGYDGAFIGGSLILPSFQQRFGLNETSSSELAANIVSTFQAGGFFGTIFAYLMTERFGRRVGLIACGLVFDVGAVLQIASHGSLPMLYVGRILTGVCAASIVLSSLIDHQNLIQREYRLWGWCPVVHYSDVYRRVVSTCNSGQARLPV
jgi:predicted MFS family arabinose efflux permease